MINYRFLSYPSYLIAHNGSCDQQTYTIISFSHSLPAKSSVSRSANVVSHTWSCLHQPAFSLYNSPVPPSSELTTKTVQVHTCCLQSFLLFKTMFLLTRTGQKLPASFFFLPLENTASRKKKKKKLFVIKYFFYDQSEKQAKFTGILSLTLLVTLVTVQLQNNHTMKMKSPIKVGKHWTVSEHVTEILEKT